jgi:hypothetical protein
MSKKKLSDGMYEYGTLEDFKQTIEWCALACAIMMAAVVIVFGLVLMINVALMWLFLSIPTILWLGFFVLLFKLELETPKPES